MAYLTRQQAAARLNVSVRVVDGLISRGQLPAYKVGSKLVRIRDEDIEKYMQRQRVTPESPKAKEKPRTEKRPCLYYPGMKVV